MNIKTKKIEVFDIVNIIVMCIVILITLGPFWICLVGSFNDGIDYLKGGGYISGRENLP